MQILPSESRTFFDSTKTTTIHASYVVGVKLTGRAGGFKLNIVRDEGRAKRYEFDAENGKQAGESSERPSASEVARSRGWR